MATTVRSWTGIEAKALRKALRMTTHEFAHYLGVAARTIAKWEARGSDIQPQPQTQAILDTALANASSDDQARFTAAVSDSLTGRTTTTDASPGPVESDSQVHIAADLSAPVLQGSVLLPVVVDGRQVMLPLDTPTVAGRGLALAMNLAPSLGQPSRLEVRPTWNEPTSCTYGAKDC